MKIKLKIDHKLGDKGDTVDVQPSVAAAFVKHDQAVYVDSADAPVEDVVEDVVEDEVVEAPKPKKRKKFGKDEVETAEAVDEVEER